MFGGTALSVRVFVYAGLSLFIVNGPYLYVVVCVLYAYNLTLLQAHLHKAFCDCSVPALILGIMNNSSVQDWSGLGNKSCLKVSKI